MEVELGILLQSSSAISSVVLTNNCVIPAKIIASFVLPIAVKKSGDVGGISIGQFNIPRGSVKVTAGGRLLQEGLDYTVNYQAGRVQILDESLKNSNVPIEISTESNSFYSQQKKRFSGINVEHKFNDNFIIGGTLMNLSERSISQKANYGVEPVNNTMIGFNGTFSSEVPFLTRLVNKLPNVNTEVKSNVSFIIFKNCPAIGTLK